MSGMSRRALLQASAGAAALAAVPDERPELRSAPPRAPLGRPPLEAPTPTRPPGRSLAAAHAAPVMFCVHDAARGEVSIMHGADEVIVRDRQLVARIMQAASRRSV